MEQNIDILKGKVLKKVYREDEEIYFIVSETEKYKMYHFQNCCETVQIEDICGDLNNLIGNPILIAEERTNNDQKESDPEYFAESCTWTFYELATILGSVTIRWYGCSNGFYSESVNFEKIS